MVIGIRHKTSVSEAKSLITYSIAGNAIFTFMSVLLVTPFLRLQEGNAERFT